MHGVGRMQTLLHCAACGCRFYEACTPLDYASDDQPSLRAQFYLEQNAGIEHMTRLLFALDRPDVDSLLDVGCGFGFAVMAAHHVLGWRACGLEPGPYGAQARELAGIDVRAEYLTETTNAGDPFAMVVASEVIEHVADPPAFLALLKRHLRPDGVLALTTPDAAAIQPGLAAGELLGILSPGGHLVLFTQDSLHACLARAGFAFIHIDVRGAGLFAYASEAPIPLRPDAAQVGQAAYQTLLRHLVARTEPATPLWNGAAQRLLSLAPPETAMPLFARIATVWRKAYGIDITDPATLPDPGPPDLLRDAACLPFCLGNVLLARARLEMAAPGRDRLREIAWLRRAIDCATTARAALLTAMLEDLDLRRIVWEARLELANSLTALAPELEGDLIAALARPAWPPGAEGGDLPPALLTRTFAPRFVSLVHAGAYALADRFSLLFQDIDQACRNLAHDRVLAFNLLYCLGVLRLNAHGDAPGAAALFARLAAEAGGHDGNQAIAAEARHFAGIARDHLLMTTPDMAHA